MSVEARVEDLKHICEKVVGDPNLEPNKDRTYCNVAVIRVCEFFGYDKLKGLTANEIYDFCERSEDWIRGIAESAHEASMIGRVAVAALRGEPHGHVAVLYPKMMLYSGKWERYVPQVANVGKKNGIMGVNWAFSDEPEYFILRKG